ncbi:MAG: hypothetical protein M3M95_06495, partial [Pseudomonadota bacterium]|nr:hypothetical protein [Pseudomonadota bacterium]
ARRTPGGGLRLTWTRRARVGGDAWDGEPPLGEAAERYRVEVVNGAEVVRAWEVSEPQASYSAELMVSDFPGGGPNPLRVRVRQGSDVFGWGAAAQRDLLY